MGRRFYKCGSENLLALFQIFRKILFRLADNYSSILSGKNYKFKKWHPEKILTEATEVTKTVSPAQGAAYSP